MLSHFRRWFFSGILITAPLALTFYVTWALITFIDDQVATILPAWLDPQYYVGFPLPGYGMIIAAICFSYAATAVGLFALARIAL